MTFLRVLLAFVALLSVVVGAVWGLVELVGLEASLIWTGLLGGVAWIIKHESEKKRELARLLAEKKREQYEKFQDMFLEQMGAADGALKVTPETYRKWSFQLSLIGSDEVLRAWNAVRFFSYEEPENESEEAKRKRLIAMFRVWGDLFLEMRKDAGHPDTKLKRSDLYGTVVNDIALYREAIDA